MRGEHVVELNVRLSLIFLSQQSVNILFLTHSYDNTCDVLLPL